MRYSFDLTIPADTPRDNPATSEVILSSGILTRAYVYFHEGCFNHVFVTVSEALFQIVPATGTNHLIGNGRLHDIPMNYPLKDSPYALTLKGWSPGTRYAHTINFYFDLQQDELALRDKFLELIESLNEGEA